MFDHACTRRKWLLAIVAGVLATFTAALAVYALGTWTALTPLPAPTEGMTVGGVGKVIIAAYGATSAGETKLTRLYNITSDSWSSGADGPIPARFDAAQGDTTHAGFLYVIGGASSGGVISDLDRYDPVTDTWTSLASMPTARAGAVAAAVDNNIFVIGGRLSAAGPCNGGSSLATVEKYDVDANTWTTGLAPMPNPRSDLAAVAHGGKIFVFGGCSGTGIFTGEVDMYNPETDTWSTGLAPMPTARASLVAGHSGQRVYAIGGWNGASLDVNEVYDIAGNSWSGDAPMLTARLEAGTHSHGGRVYVVGGAKPEFGGPTAANEVFKP